MKKGREEKRERMREERREVVRKEGEEGGSLNELNSGAQEALA